ncbi:MAG: hypothetical protein V4560_11335 [Bacteroidota bacterium]|jgi:hypothetical protein
MLRKYVIIKGQPILFSTEIIHADVVSKVTDVESAGFFIITNGDKDKKINVMCLGESVSLAINSRPEIDEEIIKEFLTLKY